MSNPIDEATHEAIAALARAKPYHNPVAIGRWIQAFHEGYYRMFDRNASYGSEQATEFFQRGHKARDHQDQIDKIEECDHNWLEWRGHHDPDNAGRLRCILCSKFKGDP